MRNFDHGTHLSPQTVGMWLAYVALLVAAWLAMNYWRRRRSNSSGKKKNYSKSLSARFARNSRGHAKKNKPRNS